jgi:hypothetical protein
MDAILYAVIDTERGPERVRLSEPLRLRVADDLFAAVTTDHRQPQGRRDMWGRYMPRQRPISYPGWTVRGRAVRFFALRHPEDPAWPASAPHDILTDDHRIATA